MTLGQPWSDGTTTNTTNRPEPTDNCGLPDGVLHNHVGVCYRAGYRAGGEEVLTDALHPEFGYEWHSPDGVIYKAARQAREERDRLRAGIEELADYLEVKADAVAITYQDPDARRRAVGPVRIFAGKLRALLDTPGGAS